MAQQNINNRISFDDYALKRKVKIYDVEKKELLFVCDSVYEANKLTGLKGVGAYIKNKRRSYKNKLGKVICFR